MFGGHKHSGSGDIMVSVCHVILQEHVIKGSFDFIGESSLWQVTNLPILLAMGIVVVEN